MANTVQLLRRLAEAFAAAMMAAMFLTFVLQILIRYTARVPALTEAMPFLDPSLYGWTLEFCLALWVWLVFWGNAFVVRDRDHVTFDMIYNAVRPNVRRAFVIIGGLAVCAGLLLSLDPTLDRFHILRLKKTATLSALFGDGIRMQHIYMIYAVFLVAVAARYGWKVIQAIRRAPEIEAHGPGRLDE